MTTPGPALAQFDLAAFTVPAGPLGSVTIVDPRVRRQPPVTVGLSLSWAHDVERASDPNPRDRSLGPNPASPVEVADQVIAQASVAATLFQRLSLGVSMPAGVIRVAQGGLDGRFRVRGGAGDLRLQVVAPLLDTSGIAMAAMASAALPTAHDRVLLGGDGPTLRFAGVLAVSIAPSLELTGRLGFLVRRRQRLLDLAQDDAAQLTLGLVHSASDMLGWFVELEGRTGVGRGLVGRQVQAGLGRLGLRLRPAHAWSLDLGVGSGAFPNGDAIDTPAVRVFMVMRYAPWHPKAAAEPGPGGRSR